MEIEDLDEKVEGECFHEVAGTLITDISKNV